MTGTEIALLSILAILVLVYSGLHVPVAFCLVSLVGVWAIKGSYQQASTLLAMAAADAVSGYDFGVIPLFVLMGLLVSVADLGRDAFLAANALLGRLKGGLGVATVAANAVFAAQAIEFGQELVRLHGFTVNRYRISRTEFHFDDLCGIGCVLGGNRPAPHRLFCLGIGVFKVTTFKANVQ